MPSSSRKFTTPQPPVTPPKLTIPPSEARQKLEAYIEKGREIAIRPINSQMEMDKAKADGEKWRDYAIRLLLTFFDTMSVAEDYENKTRQVTFSLRDLPFTEESDIFKRRMSHRIRELESILESLELYAESPTITTQQNVSKDPQADALEKIELIATHFHIVARKLRQRHNNRTSLTISDEYDVQDLFHALLRLFFDDIREEEWTPGYAGGHSRIDFLLKAEQIAIEIKMTRTGLKAKEVSDQLIIDIDRYRSAHPDCKMLVAFVYDPDGYISNPKGIERDLSKTTNGMLVKVIITQN